MHRAIFYRFALFPIGIPCHPALSWPYGCGAVFGLSNYFVTHWTDKRQSSNNKSVWHGQEKPVNPNPKHEQSFDEVVVTAAQRPAARAGYCGWKFVEISCWHLLPASSTHAWCHVVAWIETIRLSNNAWKICKLLWFWRLDELHAFPNAFPTFGFTSLRQLFFQYR